MMLRHLPRTLRLRTKNPTSLFLLRSSSTSATTTTTPPTSTPFPPTERTSVDPATTTTDTTAANATVDVLEIQASQAPNRMLTWAKSQMPRAEAMVGPRFEQTDLALQPRPMAAIELIHEEPVRFVHEHVVVCDGGGGPLGHPKIYINVDKPEVVPCGYCGLPFAHIHNKAAIVANGQGPHGEYLILD
ncbi:hypothetical protein TWF225_009629 [Orbilia oligospora]|nr:hypothetical protein TWF225_009629 [Orbilia oligospora]KAF3244409.1 hypothetical protein TWF128_009788 [Orbilia oligospora]KAF3247149.1 hypothetical protein TWF217_009796 [Orbilia oligospora]KAF3280712.1 hypothetical protein TWF132_011460 [Orbilia oligospora]